MGKAKRFLASILAAVVAFSSDGIVMAANTVISQLNKENIINISSVKELLEVADDLSGNYRLTKDFDLSDVEWNALGDQKEPFTGTFDGNGHVISHMEIGITDKDSSYIGLFGITDGAKITNLTLEDMYIWGQDTEKIYVGALAGKMTNSAVKDCYVSGNIVLEDTDDYTIGGLVGAAFKTNDELNAECQLLGCITDIDVVINKNGYGGVGGLAGYVQKGVKLKNNESRQKEIPLVGMGLTDNANDKILQKKISNLHKLKAQKSAAINTNELLSADGIYLYTIDGDNLSITGYQGTGNELIIPDTIDGYNVVDIKDYAFAEHSELTSIILPESIISIGRFVFEGTSISTIKIPKNVNTCSSESLNGMSNLKEVIFEDGIKRIPDNICAYHSRITKVVIPSSVIEIGDCAFVGCSIETIELPKKLTKIGMAAFGDCKKLNNIELPEELVEIEIGAFEECVELNNIELPKKLTKIGSEAFKGCVKLNNINLSENIVSIGSLAFYNCKEITAITLPNSLTSIGYSVFDGTGITSIAIPNSLKECKSYRHDYTYKGPLSGARKLTEVIFEEGIEEIFSYMCADNKNIKTVELPRSLKSIGKFAFFGCGLESVDLPDSITSIDHFAFFGCEFKSFVLPKNIEYIGGCVIGHTDIRSIIIPKSVKRCGQYAGYSTITLSFVYGGGPLALAGSLKEVIFEDGITKIPDGFCGVEEGYHGYCSIEKVTIPDSVTVIGDKAFDGCNMLDKIILPESLEHIGYCAFSGTKISSITIPKNLKSCNKRENADIGYEGPLADATNLSEVIFEEGVTKIPSYFCAGASCATKAKIPQSVSEIGSDVFYNCDNITIYGILNSYAETYAKENNIPFKAISEDEEENKKGFYIYTTGNALVGKDFIINGSLTLLNESENDNFDSVINAITWKSSDPDIIDVSDAVCRGTAEQLGSKVSISLNFKVVPKKAGTVTLTAATEDGHIASKEIAIEPELVVKNDYRYVTQKTMFPLCTVTLEEADEDYLKKFMSGIVVGCTNEFFHIAYSTDCILEDGRHAELLITIDPTDAYDDFYNFEIRSPAGQVEEITIKSEVGNHLWSDEDNQITTEDKIMSKAEKEYLAAFDEFIEKTQKVMKQNAGKVTDSVGNLADFVKKEYGAVITGIPDEVKEKGWENYLYEALSSKIADVANAKMSEISYSSDPVTFGTNMVKAVFNDFKYIKDSVECTDKKGKGIIVELSIWAQYGAFAGSMVCTNAQDPSESYTLVVSMTKEHTEKILKQYANDLAKLGASAVNGVYYAMAEDLLGKSLNDFTANFLEKFTKKYGQKLAEAGLGNLIDFCSASYDVYKDVNSFSKTLSDGNISKIYGQLKDNKKALDSFSDNANDKNLKRASGKVVKAAQKILILWEEYMTTGTVTSHDGIKGFIKSIISCPVSISIYDAGGTKIGYVGDDDIWYDDSISIKEQGDAKVICTPFDKEVSFKMEGTGYGTLSCAFEEYEKSGNVLGRLNYYNIPLSFGTEITAALPSEKLISENSDMAVYVDGNAVLADECIHVEDYADAGVSVELQVDHVDGGIVYGAGNYIRGNTVNLVALSKEGYIFTGWYNENDVLVSVKRNIEFAALKNVNYTAHFDPIPDDDSIDDTKDVLVQSILIQQSLTMQDGNKIQFDAKVLPENAVKKALSWSSSNPSVAVVDSNGLVTAVAAGEATITVSSTDGGNVSASCVVTVTKSDNVTLPDKDNNTEDDTGGNDSNNGNGGDNNSTGNNTSGGSSSSGGTTGGNTSGGSSSGGGTTGGNPSGNDTDNSNNNTSGDINKPDDSMQIKLLYYIVEFNANGGTKLSRKTMTLLNDDNLGILPKVQLKNYIFNGWYTQKNGGTKVNSSTVLNAGTTLFAQWTKVDKPSKVKTPSLKSKKAGQLAVSFKKITGAKGYEIAYSTKKKFPSSSTKKTVSASPKKTLKNLKSGKKYYVRVRAYKVDSTGKKIYGAYSKAKGIKVK